MQFLILKFLYTIDRTCLPYESHTDPKCLSLELKDHYEPIYVMFIAAEPSVKADRQEKKIQKQAASTSPKMN